MVSKKAEFQKLDIFIKLDSPAEDCEPKKVKFPNAFKQLKSQAGSFAKKCGIKNEIRAVLCQEADDLIDVDDDESFMICLEKASLSQQQSVTFLVQFAEAEIRYKKNGEPKQPKVYKSKQEDGEIPLKAI